MPRTPDPIHIPNQHFPGDITKQVTPVINGEPKGRNVSGRTWKIRPQKRASSLITKCPANNRSKSWKHRQEERFARNAMKAKQVEIKTTKREAMQAKRQRKIENERRRLENEYKVASRAAQTLNYNSAHLKMKAMSKKQLRQIKKTRMNNKLGVVEYVPAYSK